MKRYPVLTLVLASVFGFLLCATVFAGDTPVQRKGVPDAPTVTKQPTQQTPSKTPIQTAVPTKQLTPIQTSVPSKFPSPQQVTQAEEPCGLFARIRARRAARMQTRMEPGDRGVEVRAPFVRVTSRR